VVPAVSLTLGVCCGEVAAWLLTPLSITALVGIVGLFSAIRGAAKGGFLVGIMVGLGIGGWEILIHPELVSAGDAQMLVQVEEPPRRRIPGEVVFLGRELLGGGRRLIRCRAVDLPWRALSSVEARDIVWIRGSVVPTSRPLNPFSWDAWLWRRGVSGEMKVLFASKAHVPSPSFLMGLRGWIIQSVIKSTQESRGGALFLSMAFGVRDVLSPPVENLFATLGLSHLLVVSGYQVSLIFGFALSTCLLIGRAVRSSLTMRRFAIGVSLMCATLYVLAIGAEMSAVRALLAAVCLCLSLLIQRRHRFVQRLVTTFLCMHLLWPWALFEIGIVLTFAALAGIGIGSLIGWKGRGRSIVWVTVSVWTLTSLVTVVWNGTLSVSGLILNLVFAAPWSVLNCTVGVGGLTLLLLGVPGADILVRGVGYINEVIVSGLFWIQLNMGTPPELSLSQRGLMALALITASGLLIRAALRCEQGVSLRRMVQQNGAHGGGESTSLSSPLSA
jgi:ComEC/Rec2-related protein